MFAMNCFTLCAVIAAAFLPLVSAHGSLATFTIDGASHTGPFPDTPMDSATRMIASIDPVKDVTDAASIPCGFNASATASQIVDVTAGSSFQVQMRSGAEGTPWPHNMGPLMFYMAKCPGSADQCDPTTVDWMKTDQLLQTDPQDGTQWAQARVMAGEPINSTIPIELEDGDYLLRFELIALHNARTIDLAEFYPSCTQVRVTGGKGTPPPANALVKFPGAYKDTDPGILVDVYTNMGYGDYQPPGPPLAFGAQQDSAGASAGSASSSAPPATSTKKPAKCKVKRQAQQHKRAISRIMRRLAPHELKQLFS